MRCPTCEHQQSARLGMTSKKCGYEYTFNPKEQGRRGLSDRKFVFLIRSANQNGTKFFTSNQLYTVYVNKTYQGSRVLSKKTVLLAFLFICISAFVFFSLTTFFLVLFLFSIAAILVLVLPNPEMSRETFQRCIDQWKGANKPIRGLIETAQLHSPPPEWREADIYNYGFENLLVVQHDLLVDLLVLNNFHAEQRTLILSQNGYPNYLQKPAIKFLNAKPDMPIFILHATDDSGINKNEYVRRLGWLNVNDHPIIDIGFSPDDVRKMKRTKKIRGGYYDLQLPADALPNGSLMLGVGLCLANHSSFAEMMDREATAAIETSMSFG